MAHYEINHSPEPIRLFKSSALEFFTHIHPAVIVVEHAVCQQAIDQPPGCGLVVPRFDGDKGQ